MAGNEMHSEALICAFIATQSMPKPAPLSNHEMRNFTLYCGLSGVGFRPGDDLSSIYFSTYLSTSRSRAVAVCFRGKKGVILEIETLSLPQTDASGAGMGICCDIAWLSKFPEEMEVVFCAGNTMGQV